MQAFSDILEQNIFFMQQSRSAFITLVSVFFFWGFVAASNDILIPVFKEKLNLEQWQSQLISVAFYMAYTVGSLIYLALSAANGGDILNRIGYKNGIALGLCISAVGTLLFYPAAQMVSFGWMISGLFIVALGFSLQQTAANPLAIVMGDPSLGSQRLSLAGGINNIGTTIGPLVVSYAIFGSIGKDLKLDDISAVQVPYLVLGGAFLIVALIFKLSSLPNKIELASTESSSATGTDRKSALSYPQLSLGMLAIFLYVGVEVSTASNLPEYMRQYSGINTGGVAPYISLFWGSLMIGRWASSAAVFSKSPFQKQLFRVLMPYLAFGIFLLANYISGSNISIFLPYSAVILILVVADFLSGGNPARQLVIFSACGIASLLIGMSSSGLTSLYAFISVGLFCSTLWPCIFTLAITGLGKFTNQGSSLLIMMIMGGGLVSALQGVLADDKFLGIRMSYTVGVVCFAYLLYYGITAGRILKKQGEVLKTSTTH